MTATHSALAGALEATWPRRRHGARRRAVAALVLLLVGGASSVAAVVAEEQNALSASAGQLVSARRAVTEALAQAHHDGLTDGQLAPLRSDEEEILAEHPIARRFWLVDVGEADHRRTQATALRALLPRIDLARISATSDARRQAAGLLDDLDGAIGGASQAGLDVGSDEKLVSSARSALAAAMTPTAVRAAIDRLGNRATELRRATADKIAADAAAAELSARRDQAQGALDRAQAALADAAAFPQLQLADLTTRLAQARSAFAAASSADAYRAVASAANQVSRGLRDLLKARADAYQDLTTARQTVQQAAAAGIDVGTIPAQLAAIGTQLDGSGSADQFRALTQQIDGLANPLADRLGIVALGPGKVIVINLQRQDLVAYEDGQRFLSTLVTTGRPALPTPPGTTAVMSKNHPWHMVSDWPPDSPYWYPPSDVTYVLWFRAGGYGIHDAPWRSSYGPGTQAHGSHGCVNVPLGRMAALYDWADVGTKVIVQ